MSFPCGKMDKFHLADSFCRQTRLPSQLQLEPSFNPELVEEDWNTEFVDGELSGKMITTRLNLWMRDEIALMTLYDYMILYSIQFRCV